MALFSEKIYGKESIFFEQEGKTYVLLPLTIFSGDDKSDSDVLNQFGLRNMILTKSVYEVVDKKKLMLAKIKYGI